MDVMHEGKLYTNVPDGMTKSQFLARVSKAAAPAPASKGVGDYLRQGASAVLGAPVDAVNATLGAVGVPVSDRPFLGSAQINDVLSSGNDRYGPAAAVANGISFGTLPNIQAGVAAGATSAVNAIGLGDGKSAGETYDATLAAQQGARREYRDANPLTSMVLEGAGSVATGGALARGGATLVGNMPNMGISNLAPRMLAGGAEGGAYAAAAGFGGGEGSFSNRATGAVENIPLGVAFGSAAPAVVDLAKGVGSGAANIYRSIADNNPTGRANELLVRSIMRDKSTPEAAAEALRAAAAQGQPEFAAADALGRNTKRTLKLAAGTPGEFRDTAANFTSARQAGQSNRLGGYVDDLTGQKADTAFQTEQQILESRRAASGPAYDAAYKAPTPTDPFYTQDTLGRQSVQDAMRAAERTAAEKQVPVSELFTEIPNPNVQTATKQVSSPILGPDGNPVMSSVTETVDPTLRVPTVRGWDLTKRELDSKVNQLYSKGKTTSAEAVKETRNALRDRLGADVPEYGAALKQYKDDSALIDAINAGRDVAKGSGMALDAGEAAFKGMPQAEKDLARLGYARETKGAMTSADKPGRDMTRQFSSTDAKRKASMMAVDPEAEAVFSSRLGREDAMNRTNRMLVGGSDTVERSADAADAVNGGVLTALFSGRGRVAAARGVEALSRKASGITENVAKSLGDTLLSTDPDKLDSLARLFYAVQAKATAPSIAPTLINAGVNGPRQKNGQPTRIEIAPSKEEYKRLNGGTK